MLLLELGVLPLEGLELGDLPCRPGGRGLPRLPAQPAVTRVLPPLGQHEGVDLERRGDGLDLDPPLLTQANRGQFELVAVLPDGSWPGSGHRDTSGLVR